jgi:hypothetical protein
MSRKATVLIIAAIALVVVCGGLFALRSTKVQRASNGVTRPAQTQEKPKPKPFRSAVVELTFSSRSVHEGVEFLSATGRRIEYIDAAGGRRREDYTSTDTAMSQLTSNTAVTWIFDGSKLYAMSDHNNNRRARVVDFNEGYGGTIWADASVVELPMPGATVSEEEFLGRPCKVYQISRGADLQKWWVWNGVTLRSESHMEIQKTTILDTSEEAVHVEENVDINPDMFIPPGDVTFEPAEPAVVERYKHPQVGPWVRPGPEMDLIY